MGMQQYSYNGGILSINVTIVFQRLVFTVTTDIKLWVIILKKHV